MNNYDFGMLLDKIYQCINEKDVDAGKQLLIQVMNEHHYLISAVRDNSLEEIFEQFHNEVLRINTVLVSEVDRLSSALETERNAANNLLSSLGLWGYKSAGQTLPMEIVDAIGKFEIDRIKGQIE